MRKFSKFFELGGLDDLIGFDWNFLLGSLKFLMLVGGLGGEFEIQSALLRCYVSLLFVYSDFASKNG